MTSEEKRRMSMKKHLYKLIFAKTAFSRVLDLCEFIQKELNENTDHLLYQPLMTSICVMYAKPFTNNCGVGTLGRISRFEDKQFSDTHEMLIDARNKFYAHTDATQEAHHEGTHSSFPMQSAFFAVEYRGTGEMPRAIVRTGMTEVKMRPVVLSAVKRLCSELLQRIEREEERCLNELLDGKQLNEGVYRVNWEEP